MFAPLWLCFLFLCATQPPFHVCCVDLHFVPMPFVTMLRLQPRLAPLNTHPPSVLRPVPLTGLPRCSFHQPRLLAATYCSPSLSFFRQKAPDSFISSASRAISCCSACHACVAGTRASLLTKPAASCPHTLMPPLLACTSPDPNPFRSPCKAQHSRLVQYLNRVRPRVAAEQCAEAGRLSLHQRRCRRRTDILSIVSSIVSLQCMYI